MLEAGFNPSRRRPPPARFFLACLLTLFCRAGGTAAEPAPPTVVFLSDWGLRDGSVAMCKGLMWSEFPSLRIVDLTHESPAGDLAAADRLLEEAAPYFSSGTVFLALVDSDTDSGADSVAVKTGRGQILVGPNNGLFSRLIDSAGMTEARRIEGRRPRRQALSGLRRCEIASPAAARLAAGLSLAAEGAKLDQIVQRPFTRPRFQDGAVWGETLTIGPAGEVVTDIPLMLLEGAAIRPGTDIAVTIDGRSFTFPYRSDSAQLPKGRPGAAPSRRESLSFFPGGGHFAAAAGVRTGETVQVRLKR